MTGDWAGNVQIVRRVDIEGSEVPVVLLNNINLIVNIFDNVDSFLPDTSDGICSRSTHPTICRLGEKLYII